MVKTTVYLPEDLKWALERMAAEENRSEAVIIREAIRKALEAAHSPKPRIPLTESGLGDPTAARRSDELLRGFGEG